MVNYFISIWWPKPGVKYRSKKNMIQIIKLYCVVFPIAQEVFKFVVFWPCLYENLKNEDGDEIVSNFYFLTIASMAKFEYFDVEV